MKSLLIRENAPLVETHTDINLCPRSAYAQTGFKQEIACQETKQTIQTNLQLQRDVTYRSNCAHFISLRAHLSSLKRDVRYDLILNACSATL